MTEVLHTPAQPATRRRRLRRNPGPAALLVAVVSLLLLGSVFGLPIFAAPQTWQVSITDFNYSPSYQQVTVGDTVVWTNNSPNGTHHTVTSGYTSTDDGAFTSSPDLAPGQAFTLTFNTPGTFYYHCQYHVDSQNMKGQIVVAAPAASPSPSAAASGAASPSTAASGSPGAAPSGSPGSTPPASAPPVYCTLVPTAPGCPAPGSPSPGGSPGASPGSSPSAPSGPPGYHAILPTRIVDTRAASRVGTCTPSGGSSGPCTTLGPNQSTAFKVTGGATGIPDTGVLAVVINVTADGPSAPSYLTVWPDGGTKPTASNLNWTQGKTIANLVTTLVGSSGSSVDVVDAYNFQGNVDIIADVEGYYGTGAPGPQPSPSAAASAAPTGTTTPTAAPSGATPAATASAGGSPGATPAGSPKPCTIPSPAPQSPCPILGAPNGAVASPGTTPAPAASPSAAFGQYVPLVPGRVMDTRADTRTGACNSNGQSVPCATLGPGQSFDLQVGGAQGVPASGYSAVAFNLTAVGPTGPGYLTAYPSGNNRPTASNLNFTAGQTVPNRVVVALPASNTANGGRVTIYNFAGYTDVVVDVSGYYTDATGTGAAYGPQAPNRILDTRSGTGGTTGAVGQDATISLQVGAACTAATGAKGAVLNVTVDQPSAPSYLTVYPGSAASRPTASDLNWVAGQTVPNMVQVGLGPDGTVKVYNFQGSTHVIADLEGCFY